MPLNLIITGVGGQGNVLASQIIGRAAVQTGLKVTIGETFGLSQRGGPVMSHVRLSREKHYGPVIPPNKSHIIVGLEPLEALRILMEFGNEKTIFIVNSRPVYPLNVISGEAIYPDSQWIRQALDQAGAGLYWLEATQIAMELGGPIMLNMIMVGALCALPEFPIKNNEVKNILKDIFSGSKLEPNFKALDMGEALVLGFAQK